MSEDILNTPNHIFGDHSKCKPYFCQKTGPNEFTKFSITQLGKEVIAAFQRLANRSHRLIRNVTSNYAESYMGIMSKMISGKRINFAQRDGYANRCASAVFSYNYNSFWATKIFGDNDMSLIWSKAYKEADAIKKIKKKKRTYPKNKPNNKVDDYGPNAPSGRMTEEELKLAVGNLIRTLTVSQDEIQTIQEATIGQSFNPEWKFQRKDRLTASKAGAIYRLQDSTNNSSTLKSVLYPSDLSKNVNIKRGIDLEPAARTIYEMIKGVEVQESGFFVSTEHGFLGASPDGLVGDTGILEIKCPKHDPTEIVNKKNKNDFLDVITTEEGSKIVLKKKHIYYYQVIMQIYITNREFCDFFAYYESGETSTYHLERIERNKDTDIIWEKMKNKLCRFFLEDMAAEIVDPVYYSSKTFRQPPYRQKAMDAKQKRHQVASNLAI